MLSFDVGHKYSRADIKEIAGFSRKAKGGDWDTGIVEHEGEFLIFTNVGAVGRTGHDYDNSWENGYLRWYHKTGSHLNWKSVRRLLARDRSIHLFWRASNDTPLEYAGLASAVSVADTQPVEIVWRLNVPSHSSSVESVHSPDQLPHGTYQEGMVHKVLLNAYERDRNARDECILRHGLRCAVCRLSFEERYGPIGRGFIHVHHLRPLSEIGGDYAVDAASDLRPVCPNCHSMLHRRRPPLSIEELRSMLR